MDRIIFPRIGDSAVGPDREVTCRRREAPADITEHVDIGSRCHRGRCDDLFGRNHFRATFRPNIHQTDHRRRVFASDCYVVAEADDHEVPLTTYRYLRSRRNAAYGTKRPAEPGHRRLAYDPTRTLCLNERRPVSPILSQHASVLQLATRSAAIPAVSQTINERCPALRRRHNSGRFLCIRESLSTRARITDRSDIHPLEPQRQHKLNQYCGNRGGIAIWLRW